MEQKKEENKNKWKHRNYQNVIVRNKWKKTKTKTNINDKMNKQGELHKNGISRYSKHKHPKVKITKTGNYDHKKVKSTNTTWN